MNDYPNLAKFVLFLYPDIPIPDLPGIPFLAKSGINSGFFIQSLKLPFLRWAFAKREEEKTYSIEGGLQLKLFLEEAQYTVIGKTHVVCTWQPCFAKVGVR